MKRHVTLSSLSTFGIGGYANRLIDVEKPKDFVGTLRELSARGTPYEVIGGGSNVVFPDCGLPVTIVRFNGGRMVRKGRKVYADAGVTLMHLVSFTIKHGLSGLETLSGIPGSLGGAIVGNAGAYGCTISDNLIEVYVFDGIRTFSLSRGKCQFGYRESIFKKKKLFVLGATFHFRKGKTLELEAKSSEIIATREQKYKPELKCPGSFFKNVLAENISRAALKKIDQSKIVDGKIPTGYLLEMVGAKGLRIGDIEVSDIHGNLLMNIGHGKSADVHRISKILKTRVKYAFGIELEEEVRYIGSAQ